MIQSKAFVLHLHPHNLAEGHIQSILQLLVHGWMWGVHAWEWDYSIVQPSAFLSFANNSPTSLTSLRMVSWSWHNHKACKRGLEQYKLYMYFNICHIALYDILLDWYPLFVLLMWLTLFMIFVLHSILSSGFYQPKRRWGHSAVLINKDLYAWGGKQDGLPEVHSSDLKLRMTSVVEVFRGRVGRWVSQCILTMILSPNM